MDRACCGWVWGDCGIGNSDRALLGNSWPCGCPAVPPDLQHNRRLAAHLTGPRNRATQLGERSATQSGAPACSAMQHTLPRAAVQAVHGTRTAPVPPAAAPRSRRRVSRGSRPLQAASARPQWRSSGRHMQVCAWPMGRRVEAVLWKHAGRSGSPPPCHPLQVVAAAGATNNVGQVGRMSCAARNELSLSACGGSPTHPLMPCHDLHGAQSDVRRPHRPKAMTCTSTSRSLSRRERPSTSSPSSWQMRRA